MHPAASRVTLSDDKDKTPLTKEELFEALDEYNSALKNAKNLKREVKRQQKSGNIDFYGEILKRK